MTEDYRPVDDPEAPATRTEPAPEPPQRTTTRTTRRPGKGKATTGPRSPSKARTKKPAPPPETTPAEAIRGLLQMPATGLVIIGQRANSLPLVADGATILVHGPGWAQALADIAENDPRIMAILEKLVAFGPYGAFVTMSVIIGAQFARNHEAAPAPILEGFGAVSPEQIISAAGLEAVETPSPNGQANRVSDDDSPAI